jgi:putative endonuclease
VVTRGDPRRARGQAGEDAAADWYRARGFEVLARNWRCRDGEIDLVVRRGPMVVFCEVKSRASTAFGAPVEAVTPTKQARLRRLAAAWLRATPATGRRDVRFDVAAVLGDRVEVVEEAF